MQLRSVELVAKPVSAGSAAVPAANLHSGKPPPEAARLERALPQLRCRPAPFRASPACLPSGRLPDTTGSARGVFICSALKASPPRIRRYSRRDAGAPGEKNWQAASFPADNPPLALCPIIVGNRVSHPLAIASRNTLLMHEGR